jgi:PIN domain nuclease of toxin-antitoxin system
LLLDTHAFIWWFDDDRRLSVRARDAITDATEGFLSIASCWEIGIKVSCNKLTIE